MHTYRIINTTSGADLGIYDGASAIDAYGAMLDDAGSYDQIVSDGRDAAGQAGDLDMVTILDSNDRRAILTALLDVSDIVVRDVE